MHMNVKRLVLRTAGTALLAVAACASPASAQIYESVGIRAQGMAGAFVAVADDADAAWWNPAGLAGGAYFSAVLEYGTAQDPRDETAAFSQWRSRARGFTVAFPALGLSYYRLQVNQIQPFDAATGTAASGRQDRGRAPSLLSSLVVQEFGATVGQSVGRHLVIGSTVRLLRGQLGTAVSSAPDASLDQAEDVGGSGQTRGDLDIGAMATFSALRLGVAVKHVTEPSFESGVDRVDLRRQARAGVSVHVPGSAAVGPIIVAADADLTKTATATGDVRHVAGGAEAWLFRRHAIIRGGVAANTVGTARPTGSIGLSLPLRSGLSADGELTRGADQSLGSWGVALRVTF